jgi:RNA polymerase sigma-70 factor (ECF subfamily)
MAGKRANERPSTTGKTGKQGAQKKALTPMTSIEYHFDGNQGRVYAAPAAKYEPLQREVLHETIARLRAFSILLCIDVNLADELVAVTLTRASVAMSPVGLGTNLSIWLISRLRGYYYREYAHRPAPAPAQLAGRDHGDILAALGKLRAEQREALVLVEAIRFSFGEAARMCKQPPGRFRTLVEGARADLVRHLAKQRSERLKQDAVSLAPPVRVQELA